MGKDSVYLNIRQFGNPQNFGNGVLVGFLIIREAVAYAPHSRIDFNMYFGDLAEANRRRRHCACKAEVKARGHNVIKNQRFGVLAARVTEDKYGAMNVTAPKLNRLIEARDGKRVRAVFKKGSCYFKVSVTVGVRLDNAEDFCRLGYVPSYRFYVIFYCVKIYFCPSSIIMFHFSKTDFL